MRRAIAVAVVLIALNASAGTISSVSPSSFAYGSGEYFMTVQGTGFSEFDSLVFDGYYAGRREVTVNAYDPIAGTVVGWIPLEIVNDPGSYTVMVRSNGVLSASKGFTVTKPAGGRFTLHVPELLTAVSKGRYGATLRYDVQTSGGDGTVPTISCEPASGAQFPLGRSIVNCVGYNTVERDSQSFEVNVTDATPPLLTLPKSYQVAADSQEGAYLKYDTTATDDVDGYTKVTCLPASGDFVRPGKALVNCESFDNSFNSAFGSFEVLVVPRDLGKLALAVPDVLRVPAQSKAGAVVDFDREVYAYGSADPDPVVQCTPASHTDFRMGDTKVYCTAVDDFDQRTEATFIVSVSYDYALKMDDVSAEATAPDGADVTYDLKAEDWANEIQCSPAPGTRFAMGATDVECTSVADDGRKAVGRFTVEVADTIPPHINRAEARTGAVDVARGVVAVAVDVEALDAADAMPRCSVVDLVAETADGFDWRTKSDLEVEIRSDAPRALRMQISCVDAAGNRSTTSVPVSIDRTGLGRSTKVQ